MFVDIAHQKQLSEVFSTNRNHHCSHKRNSPTINTTSSSSSSNTMTNGQRYVADDLGKKADQILGRAPAVVDYRRQPSIDCVNQHPPRLNIPVTKSRVHNQQVSPIPNSNQSITKDRHSVSIEQLIPLIFKLVAPVPYKKLPETISRQPKHHNHVIDSREVIQYETELNLSDDENEVVNDENQNEIQHSNSDTENDDELNQINPHTFSLKDFLPVKHSPTVLQKRNLSPPPPPPTTTTSTPIKQTKRKEELIKSFSSSVNIPIDIKQPTLPITIPTYLFFDRSIKSEVDEQIKSSKRYINGSIKQETNIDTNETSSSSSNSSSTQPKRNKTSHVYKQEPNNFSINIKDEPNLIFSNDTTSAGGNMATIAPMTVQPKKEKPTANVKPLLQSSLLENLSSTNSNPNVVNPPTTTIHNSTRMYYANLKHMSTKELNSLAREKKKQADGEKRTFEDVKQSMSLYLESVCYFIQCANDEPILEQRNSLLMATLNMLQHLAYNYQKMFHIPTNQSTELLNNIRQKFLLINYWLQSYIYHLQFNTNFSSIERCANQVTEYFSHSKSPADVNHNFIYDFSKYMLNSYHSNYYWNKAERLIRDEPLKKFAEQLSRQNSNRHLSRDDSTLDFLLYIFDSIDLLRITNI